MYLTPFPGHEENGWNIRLMSNIRSVLSVTEFLTKVKSMGRFAAFKEKDGRRNSLIMALKCLIKSAEH